MLAKFCLRYSYAKSSQYQKLIFIALQLWQRLPKLNIHTKGDVQWKRNKLREEMEKIKAGKEKALAMFKALEAYFLANSDAYN